MLLFGKQGRLSLKTRKFRSTCLKLTLLGIISIFIFFGGITKIRYVAVNRSPCSSPTHDENGNSQCLPIKATRDVVDTSDGEVHGKFMEKLETPRKLMNFLSEPRDVTSLPGSCNLDKDQVKWGLVFFVKSAISNFKRRSAIRESWGSLKFYRSVAVKVIFLVGTEVDVQLQEQLDEEMKKNNDILQLQLLDFSRTVPEKVLAGMQWSAKNFPPEWVYASLDDDMAIYLPNLIDYLNKLMAPVYSNQTTNSIKPCYQDLPVVCVNKLKIRDTPERSSRSKWYVSEEEFPGNTWPTYCRGGLYLMSNKLASEIFEKSRTTAYLSMDDVWITGFMRRQLGVGDCNIMGSPYSGEADLWIWNLFYDTGGDKAFMKHLWGNIAGWKVDVPKLLREEWNGWRKRTGFNEGCVVVS